MVESVPTIAYSSLSWIKDILRFRPTSLLPEFEKKKTNFEYFWTKSRTSLWNPFTNFLSKEIRKDISSYFSYACLETRKENSSVCSKLKHEFGASPETKIKWAPQAKKI